MVIKNNLFRLLTGFAFNCTILSIANADNIAMNTAQLQALDKVTGQMSIIDVPVNGEARFGSFSIVVRSCQTTPPEDVPENYAFIDVADTNREGQVYNIFKGWMVSSSPSLNSVEHPVYDVWLLKCINSEEKKIVLTEAQLEERDKLEKLSSKILSKEAQIAIELQEEQAKKEEIAKKEKEEQNRLQEEEKEAQLRLKEINKELEQQKDLPEVDDNINNGEGPVVLFNINKQDIPDEENIIDIETDQSQHNDLKENELTSDYDNQVLEVPEDISEIMTENQIQD